MIAGYKDWPEKKKKEHHTPKYKVGGGGKSDNLKVYDHVVKNMNNISEIKLALREKTAKVMGRAAHMLSAPDHTELME